MEVLCLLSHPASWNPFGCGYRRIADHACSATTLRRRRDEWITLGLAEQLKLLALAAHDRLFGLERPAAKC